MILDTAKSFDQAVITFTLEWLGSEGHTLSRRVAHRTNLTPGRGMAFVIEGTPLVRYEPGQEWDFMQWSDGSPVPLEGNSKLSIGGRVRWFDIGMRKPDRSKVLWADARYPDDAGRDMLRRYLDADPRHIALFEETYNSNGSSATPACNHRIVLHRGEVMHLISADTTDQEIENTWDAASGYGGGEWIGVLTSLPDVCALAPGDDVTEDLLDVLAVRAKGIFLKVFDGEGLLAWVVGDPPPAWSDGH